jgi:hypothetical protein
LNWMRVWILLSASALIGALALLPRIGRMFHKPLRIGDRVRISGGHQEPPPWLEGRDDVEGTVTGVVPRAQSVSYEVTLDSPLARAATDYRFALLQLRFTDARWARNGVVHVELWAGAPSKATSGADVPHEHVESHAVYRAIVTDSVG